MTTDKTADHTDEDLEDAPDGCLACNEDEEKRAKLQAILDRRGVRVEKVPTPRHAWGDLVVCRKCGQAWVLMSRDEDPNKPVA